MAFGGDWTSQLYFDDDSDKSSGSKYAFTDSELRIQLRAVTNEDETITQIWTYSHKLKSWQPWQGKVNQTNNTTKHNFCV